MRKHIVNEKIRGTLVFVDGPEFENVSGEISYDVYSNRGMRGEIFLESSASLLRQDPFSLNQIVFRSNEIEFFGKWKSVPFPVMSGNVTFSIVTLSHQQVFNDDNPSSVEIRFLIPYISPLARDLKSSFGFYDEYIVKFNSEEFRVLVDGTEVTMKEYANLVSYEEPDCIFNRTLKAVVLQAFSKEDELLDIVHSAKTKVENFLLIVSLLVHRRFNTYGFEADVLNRNGKLIERKICRSSEREMGEDYTDRNYGEFSKYFNMNNLTKLTESFYSLNEIKRNEFRRVVNAYLTIGELRIFEPMFRDTYFALDAVSKLIVSNSTKCTEDRLIEACEQMSIIAGCDVFECSIKSKDKNCKWLITEYRNELTHFNFDPDIMRIDIGDEYVKMLKLLRMLLLGYLDVELKNFPLP